MFNIKNILLLYNERLLYAIAFIFLYIQSNSYCQAYFCDDVICHCGINIYCECTDQIQAITIHQLEISAGCTNLTIYNCNKVTFEKNSIKLVDSLRYLNIKNVKQLSLLDSSLEWQAYANINPNQDVSGLNVRIENTEILTIGSYSFKGQINNIIFQNVTINHIKTYAFANLNSLHSIYIEKSTINNIAIRSFNKFQLNNFIIKYTTFTKTCNSDIISDVTILHLLHLSNCYFSTIKTSAAVVRDPIKVEILNCTFDVIESEVFRIEARGDISIEDNKINKLCSYAFVGLRVNEHTLNAVGPRELLFKNNQIDSIDDYSLLFNRTNFHVSVYKNYLKIDCNCDELYWQKKFLIGDLNEIFCIQHNKFMSVKQYFLNSCELKSNLNSLILVFILFVLIVFIVTAIVYYKLRHHFRVNNRLEKGFVSPPEQKTYQINEIVEETELLNALDENKQKYQMTLEAKISV